MTYIETVDELSEKAGILPEFAADGKVYPTSFETKIALLKACGYDASDPERAEAALKAVTERPFKRALPPVVVARLEKKNAVIPVTFPKKKKLSSLKWKIETETGKVSEGTENPADMEVEDELDGKERRLMTIPLPLELGYHTLTVEGKDLPDEGRKTTLIVAPTRCYEPEMMKDGGKPWGFPVQLYALRSAKNWGIGDFSDLAALAPVAKSFGADILGINPINAAFAADWDTASPYYSSSRLFFNPIYIDVDAVAGAKTVLKKWKASVKGDIERARASELVNYPTVGKLKTEALRLLFNAFKGDKDFDAFCAEGGKELETAALYQALSVYFVNDDGLRASADDLDRAEVRVRGALGPVATLDDFPCRKGCGFKSWGKSFATPDAEGARRFAAENADELRFYKFMFWIADRQFEAASKACDEAGLRIGLYQDLAVGVASESAETWGAQNLFSTTLSIGSPPDMFNANGQSWGVAPMLPEREKEEAYMTYRRILSANMKRAGAVRIDHVMGLARLFCIPPEAPGAYLLYPFKDIVGIVALESFRNRCLVVGEDLGVVPDFFRDALAEAGILSFRVCRYEKTADGRYIDPESYPVSALVAAGTHDMPTLSGWWAADDVKTMAENGLMTDADKLAAAFKDRRNDRMALVTALSRRGKWFVDPRHFDAQIDGDEVPSGMTAAIYGYLSKAPCRVFLVQLEDLLGQLKQMNMPGTSSEYPNWRHKLPKTIEELESDDGMIEICRLLRDSRG